MFDQNHWDQHRKCWNSHKALHTIDHNHVSCYSPAEGFSCCDVAVVECADGRFFIEDSYGDVKPKLTGDNGERVFNPHDPAPPSIHFFPTQAEAMKVAESIVAAVSGVLPDE